MTEQERIDTIIATGARRTNLFNLIPAGSRRILDIGYGQGALLMMLKRDKQCRELYGIETHAPARKKLDGLLEGNWGMNLGDGTHELEDRYRGFFNYLILHDVLEHVPDPWYFLPQIKKYCAAQGRIIIVSPNAQYWDIVHMLLHGDFPYGCGGLMNEDHIRWFTVKSLIEIALLSGLKVDRCILYLAKSTLKGSLDTLQSPTPISNLQMPPPGFKIGLRVNPYPFTPQLLQSGGELSVSFGNDLKPSYLHFLAVKICLMCSVHDPALLWEPMCPGSLQKRRETFFGSMGEDVHALYPHTIDYVLND